MSNQIQISVVSPVYNADKLVDSLVERITASVSKITPDFEIVLVDDFSPDNSWKKIEENCKKFSYVKGIKLSKNFGQQHAIAAGMENAKGNWIVIMDCDLQDRPEEIPNLYTKALEGFDIVLASRVQRRDDFFKKTFSKAFYSVLGYLTGTKQDDTVANFAVLSRKVVNAIISMGDYHRYFPTMVKWVGFKITTLEIQHADREDGKKSSYSYKKRLDLAINTILSFSDKPLRLAVKLGLAISFISALYSIYAVILFFEGKVNVTGWTSLFISIWFFSGLIISVLGMIGLYLGKTFETVKNRPIYIIEEKLND